MLSICQATWEEQTTVRTWQVLIWWVGLSPSTWLTTTRMISLKATAPRQPGIQGSSILIVSAKRSRRETRWMMWWMISLIQRTPLTNRRRLLGKSWMRRSQRDNMIIKNASLSTRRKPEVLSQAVDCHCSTRILEGDIRASRATGN